MSQRIRVAQRELEKATKRLASEQGRIARRNARQAVLKQLRRLRQLLDAEYPNIPKANPNKPKTRKPWVPPKDWVLLDELTTSSHNLNYWMAGIAEAKAPCRKYKNKNTLAVPAWVVAALLEGGVSKLVEAKKSRNLRAALVAAVKLKAMGGDDRWVTNF